jgi:hypothetical protein
LAGSGDQATGKRGAVTGDATDIRRIDTHRTVTIANFTTAGDGLAVDGAGVVQRADASGGMQIGARQIRHPARGGEAPEVGVP